MRAPPRRTARRILSDAEIATISFNARAAPKDGAP